MKALYIYQAKDAVKKSLTRRRFYILALVFMIPSLLNAQPAQNPILYKELQLDKNTYTVRNLMHAIYAQSSISFSYNSKKIDDSQKIKIQERRITVYNAMATVKRKTGIKYRMVGNHIILMAGNPVKKTVKKKPEVEEAIIILSKASDPENIEELKGADVFIPTKGVVDMNIKADISFLSQQSGSESRIFSAQDGVWIDPYNTLNSTPGEEKNFKASDNSSPSLKNRLLLQAGLSADELYYLNPTLHAGFDFLYASVSYNAIGKYPHVRFGIGSSLKLTEAWRLHINANTGPARSAPFNVQRVTDSFFVDETDTSEAHWSYLYEPFNMRVKSRLNRVSLNLEWRPSTSISIMAGATLNVLNTTYESDGSPTRLSDFSIPAGDDPEHDYISIKPPYLLSSNFSLQNPSNTKLWVGFNFSLLYNIPLFNKD